MSERPRDDAPGSPAEQPTWLLAQPVFIAAIALSAFLLFTLELLSGAVVLPVFGGASSVWTTTLCFFTAVVFVGYLYSHLVATRLSQRAGAVLHLGVAVAVVVATVSAPRDLGVLRVPSLPAAVNVLFVLALVAGAPALLLATTTPLLSDWFSQQGRSPWWLYAVSNAASLGALLAYPLLIEPLVPLSVQRSALAWMLAALVVLLAVIAAGSLAVGASRRAATRAEGPDAAGAGSEDVPAHQSSAPAPAGLPVDSAPPAAAPLTLRRQAVWLFAASVPAGLMAATTTLIATDHASAPLLWAGPLGVYLLSFVIAFSARGRRTLPLAEKLVPAAVTLMWVPYVARVDWPAWELVAMLLLSLGVLSVAVHGRLAQDRPAERELTRFYLVISAGGMVATAFVALVAPLVFSDVYEYPLLLVGGLAALALLPGTSWLPLGGPGATLRAAGWRLLPFVVVGALLVGTIASSAPGSAAFVGVLLLVGTLAIVVGRTPRSLAMVTAVAIVVLLLVFTPSYLTRIRTFYGITEVRLDHGGAAHTEIHGTTVHGVQFLDARATQPTAYYVRSGPLGDVFANLATRLPGGAAIGATGLGVGTVSAYQRPLDTLVYFEIDPGVVSLAENERYFSYLSQAPAEPLIVLGDGRLSLAEQPRAAFDLLVLDAFSSDTVPTHLLTREALLTYARTLRPRAVMAFHLTNRHFDLVPAVAATARSVGLDARTRSYQPSATDGARFAALPSRWLVVGRPGDLAWFDAHGWQKPSEGPVLSDDYADILRLLRWQ